jgi:hypothetical protein
MIDSRRRGDNLYSLTGMLAVRPNILDRDAAAGC